jgi:hypothetical protein
MIVLDDGHGYGTSAKADVQTQFGGYQYEELGFTLGYNHSGYGLVHGSGRTENQKHTSDNLASYACVM